MIQKEIEKLEKAKSFLASRREEILKKIKELQSGEN